MLALDGSRSGSQSLAFQRACPSAPSRTSRSRVVASRPHEVARRRPAGRLVEYGATPAGAAARRPQQVLPSSTRRRLRVLVACALLAMVLAGAGFGLASLAGANTGDVPTQTGVVQVHQGETLSELSARVAPGASRSAVVQRIVQLNGLTDVAVRAGQALVVPLAR